MTEEKKIPWTRFDPDDESTHPPHMSQCFALWLEGGKAKFTAFAVCGFEVWFEVLKAEKGVIKKKRPIKPDPFSLAWVQVNIPEFWIEKKVEK